MRKNMIWVLVLVLIVISCNSTPNNPDPDSIINLRSTEIVTPRSAPIPVPLATPTVEDNAVLVTPVLSNEFEQKCAEYNNQGFIKSQGFLLLNKDIPLPANQEQNISIVNLNNGTFTPFNGKAFSVPTVYNISPNREWYFYLDTEIASNQLHVKSIDGQEKSVMYWDKNWAENINMSWLDDDHLSIIKFSNESPREPHVIILNPSTGEWQILEPNFPSGRNNDMPMLYIDPSLSRVIYISGDSYVLWDVETGRDIWRRRGVNFSILPRGWSPDGNNFAFISASVDKGTVKNEIYSVNRQGQETQLTDLSAVFPLAGEIYVLGIEWSPNSKYIAFSFLVKGKDYNFLGDPLLALVDIDNKKTINLCVPISQYMGEIIWSPFSNQVAITSTVGFDSAELNAMIVDIKSYVGYELNNNASTLGWMITP